MYSMQLADETVVEFEGMNGTNYIVGQEAMDTSIFTDENLKKVTVTDDDGNVETFENLSFIQQQKQLNGDYYVCFREKSTQELLNEARDEKDTEMQLALVELYEMILGGE